ncbi:MAG: phosphodiesterase [Monoglobaceae bacterium]
MKWLIASDIHGSAHFCGELLNAYKAEMADRLLLLGDILYHGPRNDLPYGYNPKKTAEMLNNMKSNIVCVRGNCDAEVDLMVLGFPIVPVCSLILGDSVNVFASHGHIYNIDNPPPQPTGGILLYGHTHVPLCEKRSEHIFLNPGSVSIPKEASPHSYMTYENGTFLWKDLSGNIYNEFSFTNA